MTLPREHAFAAVRAGGRFVANSPALLAVIARAIAFVFFAGAIWALLPLVARERLGLGSGGYGLLLGCVGVGALLAATFGPALRRRLPPAAIYALACLLVACAAALLAVTHSVRWRRSALVTAGAAWITGLGILSTAYQGQLPTWAKARALRVLPGRLPGRQRRRLAGDRRGRTGFERPHGAAGRGRRASVACLVVTWRLALPAHVGGDEHLVRPAASTGYRRSQRSRPGFGDRRVRGAALKGRGVPGAHRRAAANAPAYRRRPLAYAPRSRGHRAISWSCSSSLPGRSTSNSTRASSAATSSSWPRSTRCCTPGTPGRRVTPWKSRLCRDVADAELTAIDPERCDKSWAGGHDPHHPPAPVPALRLEQESHDLRIRLDRDLFDEPHRGTTLWVVAVARAVQRRADRVTTVTEVEAGAALDQLAHYLWTPAPAGVGERDVIAVGVAFGARAGIERQGRWFGMARGGSGSGRSDVR